MQLFYFLSFSSLSDVFLEIFKLFLGSIIHFSRNFTIAFDISECFSSNYCKFVLKLLSFFFNLHIGHFYPQNIATFFSLQILDLLSWNIITFCLTYHSFFPQNISTFFSKYYVFFCSKYQVFHDILCLFF